MRGYDRKLLEKELVTWEERAEILWGLLDDIETAGDRIKPKDLESFEKYYDWVKVLQAERELVLESDGFTLFIPGEL